MDRWWRLIFSRLAYLIPMKLRVAGLLFLLILCTAFDLPGQDLARGKCCFMWYNVENLFYPDDDSIDGDDEFTPQGLRHWTWSRYRAKLTSLAKVIIAAGRGKPPELVALCEVESALVLQDLSIHPILAPYHYSYLHEESPDHRGMDVACLVRQEMFESVHCDFFSFARPVTETRDIMHISLSWGGDTLDLFLVHLLSKYGGAGATADLRRSQTEQMVQLMDSVYGERQHGLLLTAGDFNDVYGGYSMEPLKKVRFGGDSLTLMLPEDGKGSYKYMGQWSRIDQVLVLQALQQSRLAVSCLHLAPLLTEDLKYGGIKPKRTYEGYRYRGGISDHLPLLIDFNPSDF